MRVTRQSAASSALYAKMKKHSWFIRSTVYASDKKRIYVDVLVGNLMRVTGRWDGFQVVATEFREVTVYVQVDGDKVIVK